VSVVTDTEATKTVGLAYALLEEGRPGRTPRADVFWNNEPVWTTRLAEAGALEPYDSPAARDVPAAYRDPRGFWTANGLRARVYIANSGLVKEGRPASYLDLADPAFRDRGSLARPLAGTTLSHLAARRSLVGAEPFAKWLRDAAANGAAFASGNGAVAREVGRGTRAFGFTDTDDFHARRAAGDPVEAIFPDQGEGGIGTFVLPITVSVVRGAPHPRNARRLHDWLVSPAAEEALSATPYATIPVRTSTRPGPGAVSPASFRAAKADWSEAVKHVDPVLALVAEILQGKYETPPVK
jgi:iron(III) transport system substrate-binding protein